MNLTLDEAMEEYISYSKLKLKPQSISKIYNRYENQIKPLLGNKFIDKIEPKDILDLEKNLFNKNFSFSYEKAVFYVLVSLLNYCCTFLGLEKNVAKQVGLIHKRKDNKMVDFWTIKEYKRFIKKVDVKMYKYLFEFLYFTGCRQGEALELHFYNLNKNYVFIENTVQKECSNGRRIVTSAKTEKSKRKFKIDFKLRFEIFLLKKYYKKKYGYFSQDFLIFGGKNYLSPTTIARYKNIACKKANVKQIRIHDFRHSHISLLISKGVPITAICERVGHKDVSLTLNVYAHMLNSDEKKLNRTLFLLRFLTF